MASMPAAPSVSEGLPTELAASVYERKKAFMALADGGDV